MFRYAGHVVHFLPDACHNLKLIRNSFEFFGTLTDIDGGKLKWSFLWDLHHLQERIGMNFANKLSMLHLNFHNQIMKVYLASQVFCRSIAAAIRLCKDEMGMEIFKESQSTIDYLNLFNNLFDIFNSRSNNEYIFKNALKNANAKEVFEYLEYVRTYIINLKLEDKSFVVNSRRKTGFIGFFIGINSLIELYKLQVVEEQNLLFIPMNKFSQDHLEMYFSKVRAMGGFNNNPTIAQFISAFKTLLLNTQLKANKNGNCIALT